MASEKIRVFVNGLGRIGRSAARILLEDARFDVVGCNDLYSFAQMAYLLQYDSVHGTSETCFRTEGERLFADGRQIALFNQPDPAKLPLQKLGVDVVLECTGYFLSLALSHAFLEAGAQKVVVSAPPKDEMPLYICGVNEMRYGGEAVISNSSCSANVIVPIFQMIDTAFGIESAMMSMYHSYTAYQHLLDTKHYSEDIRRARSATQNIIPLQSSAAEATAAFFPKLRGKLYAKSVRIPLAATTFYDLTIRLHQKTTQEALFGLLHEKTQRDFDGIVAVTTAPKVSTDYIGDPHSAVVDLSTSTLLEGDLLRIGAWQDNEYGYARRLVDMAAVVGRG